MDSEKGQKNERSEFGAGIARCDRSVNFFLESIQDPDKVSEANMAFHAGAFWTRATEKVQLLSRFLEKSIPLRVLINEQETVEPIISHMRMPMKRYVSLEDNLMEWAQLASIYPDQVMVRVARRPMLHRIYLVRNRDGSGSVSVGNYLYGNSSGEGERDVTFADPEKAFLMYRDEFDYLWEHLSDPISEFADEW